MRIPRPYTSLALERVLLLLCIVSAARDTAAGATPFEEDVMQGKVRTARSIEFVLVVEGTPAEVFELWTQGEHVIRWFGTGANLDPRVGGIYEIQFGLRPDGETAGPRENRILSLKPGRALDFEWDMPQFAKELNTKPLPTWVEVRFELYSEEPAKTQIRFSHLGFGEGELWDRCIEFFERGWFDILFRLKLYTTYFAR